MVFKFSQAYPKYAYEAGSLFVGLDEQGHEIGVKSDRHAVTIGGARSGKGAAQIVPNARRWPHNLLLIDPKGENIELSYQHRQKLGQAVRVLDPFRSANVPDDLRAGFNPFDLIDAASPMAREDIQVISDGLVVVHDPKHMEWVEGTRSILSGLSAFVIETGDDQSRHLGSVRNLLLLSKDQLEADIIPAMFECAAFGGLARAAAVMMQTGLNDTDSMEADFLNKAKRATDWLDSEPIKAAVTVSTFNLRELKNGESTVALVLPPRVLVTHGVFLRLFVRLAINVMAEGERLKRRCLFVLDEFPVLGRIDEVAKAAGFMPGYGLHLWLFAQDLGQLKDLYSQTLTESFFGNSDMVSFFGNTDPLTLDYVSQWIGNFGLDEVAPPPKVEGFDPAEHEKENFFFDAEEPVRRARHEAKQQNAQREYAHGLQMVGKRRVPPEQVAALVRKPEGEPIARTAIIFTRGAVINPRLWAYFQDQATERPDRSATPAPASTSSPSYKNLTHEDIETLMEMQQTQWMRAGYIIGFLLVFVASYLSHGSFWASAIVAFVWAFIPYYFGAWLHTKWLFFRAKNAKQKLLKMKMRGY